MYGLQVQIADGYYETDLVKSPCDEFSASIIVPDIYTAKIEGKTGAQLFSTGKTTEFWYTVADNRYPATELYYSVDVEASLFGHSIHSIFISI